MLFKCDFVLDQKDGLFMERIGPGSEKHGDRHDEEVERNTNFHKIAKAITAGPIDHEIRLIADGSSASGGGSHHDGDDDGNVTDIKRVRGSQSEGKNERGGGVLGNYLGYDERYDGNEGD